MSRSLRVDPKYIQKVNLALKRNGYPSQRKFAEDIVPCLSTVKNFLKGKPVDYENFREICERLGLDWQAITYIDVGVEQEEAIAKPEGESGEAIDTSVTALSSERGLDYTLLWELLAASQWLKADRETLDIMLKVSGREKERWLRVEDIQKISYQVLRTIDQLWVEYSQKRFGFSVQQKLIRLSRRDTDIETWLQFALCVGWRKSNKFWLTWLEIQAEGLSLGGNIAESFPIGFFPYQYSLGFKIYRGAIGDWREPSPVSAFLLLHRNF